VFNIDATREYAVTSRASLTIMKRFGHSSVCCEQYVYVIGGGTKQCERYDVAEDRWEVFGVLPGIHNVYLDISLVLMETTHSIYLIGGQSFAKIQATGGEGADFIWRLDLVSLAFEVLDVKLPRASSCIPCFKLSPKSPVIYMLLDRDLYSFNPSTSLMQHVRRVTRKAQCRGPCYYVLGGTLHFSDDSQARTLAIGELF
jgi:hypothetical protein